MIIRNLLISFLIFLQLDNLEAANSCKNMDDEKILQTLTDTQERLTCKSSLSFGAACAGIIAAGGLGAAIGAKTLAKRNVLRVSRMFEEIAQKSVQIEALKYQQRNIAATGDLSLATNSSGDAKIKIQISDIEKELDTLSAKLEKELQSDKTRTEISKYADQKVFKARLEIIEKNIVSISRYNPKESKNYHKVIEKLLTRVTDGFSESQLVKSSEAVVRKSSSLKAALSLGKKALDSRLFQFLGGATFTGASLFVYSKNTACNADTSLEYLSYDQDCKPVVEISDNVIDFLEADPLTQIKYLRKNAKACDFYLSLAAKIRIEDRESELILAKTKNLSCGKNISFQVADDKNVSSYKLDIQNDKVKKFSNVDEETFLNFNTDGVISQFCENNSCDSIRSNQSKVSKKILERVNIFKYAASEALKCCQDSSYQCQIDGSIRQINPKSAPVDVVR